MRRHWVAAVSLVVLVACTETETDSAQGVADTTPRFAFEATATERADIVSALQTLFDALETGDAELLRDVMDPDIVMHSSGTNAAGETSVSSSTLERLAARIEASEVPLIERMWDPLVSVNGSMAMIWAPYDFYSGAEFSHCGVDTATLMNTEEGWKMISLAWTRLQPPACALHPDGPPGS